MIPAGEHWPDGSLRPALEDLLGAGAIIDHLAGSLSPEAQAAADLYRASMQALESRIRRCSSGKELIDRGFERDVMLACEFDVSAGVPILVGNAYVRLFRPGHNDRYLKG
ncbi:MAG: 2-phosphosulfolactate phosphatase [Candidatus Entotheonellia bacterium]